eukprot:scaffold9.g3212.t1
MGTLAAALMIGIMTSCPCAAALSKRRRPLRLLGGGLALFCGGAAACAAAPGFGALLAARVVLGLGCGPFISLASPLVDDAAPPKSKSSWLAVLFLCIPTGFAGGYIVGGLVGSNWGWRAPFVLEALAMAPLALACVLGRPPPPRKPGAADVAAAAPGAAAPPPPPPASFCADLWALLSSPLVVATVAALSVFNGALGGLAFYGPKAARDLMSVPPETADLLFGAITVGTGVLGTLLGGLLLDASGASVRNALALCIFGVAAGTAACAAAFAAATTLQSFCAALAAGQLGIFLIAAPANAVLLWSVAPELRPLALSFSEVSQHLLGDIPSPPLLGWLQSHTGDWRLTMGACTALLGASALLFGAALCLRRGTGGRRLEVLVLDPEALLLNEAEAAMTEGDGCEAAPAGADEPLLAPWERGELQAGGQEVR